MSGWRGPSAPAPTACTWTTTSEQLLPADRAALEALAPSVRRVTTVGEAVGASRPVAAVEGDVLVRLLPRVGQPGAVVLQAPA